MRSWPSLTAEAVCLARALEHRRTDRLVDDPHAVGFLRAPMRAVVRAAGLSSRASDLAEWGLDPGLIAAIGARSGWIDEHLASAAPQLDQVLLLGAGYDSRPWRLPLAHTVVLELDHPATARRKARRVSRLGLDDRARHTLTADLATESLRDALKRSPLQPDRPSAVVWEGVSMYLDEASVQRTLRDLRAFLGPHTIVLMDLWSPVPGQGLLHLAERSGRVGLAALGEPLRFELPPQAIAGWLDQQDWSVQRHTDTDTRARQRTGRRAFPPLQLIQATPSR